MPESATNSLQPARQLLPADHIDSDGAQATAASGGYCRRCRRVHLLPAGGAAPAARQLMAQLAEHRRLDFLAEEGEGSGALGTEPLFGPAGGKMFGVLEAVDRRGGRIFLRAFSGSYQGRWQVPGWAPPLFDLAEFLALTTPCEERIKALGAAIDAAVAAGDEHRQLLRQRRQLSQTLMRDIHRLYRLPDCRGNSNSLEEAFLGGGRMPSGTGDCCAPKLIATALNQRLRPLSLAEFYWGRAGAAGLRQHGHFYPACAGKCTPILGSMLCGGER